MAGVLRATLPTSELTVAWDHSVEKTRWEERYRIDGTRLRLVEARVMGSGAGMEPPPDATLRGGWWTWHPSLAPLPQLRLTLSPFTRDYDLCWRRRCQTLGNLVARSVRGVPPGATGDQRIPDASYIVEVRACTGKNPSRIADVPASSAIPPRASPAAAADAAPMH